MNIAFNVNGLDEVKAAIKSASDAVAQLERAVEDISRACANLGLEANQLAENPPAD